MIVLWDFACPMVATLLTDTMFVISALSEYAKVDVVL
jgi:hypothetical protein